MLDQSVVNYKCLAQHYIAIAGTKLQPALKNTIASSGKKRQPALSHKFQTYVDANYLPPHRYELCLLIHAEIFFINHED